MTTIDRFNNSMKGFSIIAATCLGLSACSTRFIPMGNDGPSARYLRTQKAAEVAAALYRQEHGGSEASLQRLAEEGALYFSILTGGGKVQTVGDIKQAITSSPLFQESHAQAWIQTHPGVVEKYSRIINQNSERRIPSDKTIEKITPKLISSTK